MHTIEKIFLKFGQKTFFQKPVKCTQKEEVDIDNPAYSQLDPYMKYDEEEMSMPFQRSKRAPPSFDTLLNNIMAVTKKHEHVKGFKFEINMGASHKFHFTSSWCIPNTGTKKVGQTMAMSGSPGKMLESSFQLGLQYQAGSVQQIMTGKPKIILTARWESTGKLEAAVIKQINDKFLLRFQAGYPYGSDLQYSQVIMDLDYTGFLSANMMQTLSDNLVAGFEFFNIIPRKMSLISYAARYQYKNNKLYAQYQAQNDLLTLAHQIQIQKRAQIVSEFTHQGQTGETNTIVGFRQRFTTSEILTTINTKGKIASVLTLIGMTYSLKLSAIADYKKDNYKFGYGLTLGQVGM